MQPLTKDQIALAEKEGWTLCDREIENPRSFYQTLLRDGETDLLHAMQTIA